MAFENDTDPAKDECHFDKCLKKIRQTGCDVLLKKTSGTVLEDPCLTDYGGNWSPITLITDYGREQQAQGNGKYNDLLLFCLKILEEKQYSCVDDILKFLLLLKKPIVKESSKILPKQVPFSESEVLLQALESDSLTSDSYPQDGLPRTSSQKKALRYQESWTKHFDYKFQLLGECSKKNLLTPEKVSLNSLFSSRPIVNTSQSRSNSFVFPDFSYARNYRSEKSLFDINSGTYLNESLFLDNFVDHPISHKLPALSLNPKFSSKNGFLERPCAQTAVKFPSFPEEVKSVDTSQPCCSKKPSIIELKRNFNCSHSLAILYEKSARGHASSSASTDSLAFTRSFKTDRNVADPSTSRYFVLALWEQDRTLIREFRPELAGSFPTLRMISHSEYVEDVKYMFTGINSRTFPYDPEENLFKMAYGTCLDDVTPESLCDYSQEFLQIGNCYVKLNAAMSDIGKNNFDSCTTITQAFWKSISDYMELHYSLVLDIPISVNLMALKSCTRDLHQIIVTVANICKVLTPGKILPKGGELLTYLLQFAEKITNQSVINVVFGILQNCCSVYFTCVLQNWMFKGQLGEEGDGELFVDCRREIVKTKSRAYYSSFYLVEENIPSFLRGHEESIYNCGKSVHFLKLFNAKDKLCQILEKGDFPTMRLCFSEEQLGKLEREFKSYEERVIKSCGKRVTIKTIRDEEERKKKVYSDYIRECKLLEEEKRELMRIRHLEEVKAAKEKQNQLLNEQWSSIEAEKVRRKEEEEEQRLQLEKEIKNAEMERENIVNNEKRVLKEYYDHMMANLSKKMIALEKRKECLKKILHNGINSPSLDIVNDNCLLTDEEGNIISKFDINSNSSSIPSEMLIRMLEPEPEPEPESDLESNKSIAYDENSNPNPMNKATSMETEKTNEPDPQQQSQPNPGSQQVTRKCVSHRTVAAEEAKRNKCKILMSEFALPVRKSSATSNDLQDPALTPTVILSDLEGNRGKVLESAFDLLKQPSHYSLKKVPSKLQFIGDSSVGNLQKDNSSHLLVKAADFTSVGLERKLERTNLNTASRGTISNEPVCTDSSDSFVTTSNELSVEVASNVFDDSESLRTPKTSSMLFNEKYQDALMLDSQIFYHKITFKHIFCSLRETEMDSLLCTDFMMFQRCLRKSFLLPLKIQEKLANDALLKHLLKGENLLSHLRSLRGYFFLNDGEFGRSFTHHTFRSLAKCTEPKQFFERSNLSNIVNEALNYTIHNCEPNAQNLSFRIVKMPPYLNHSSHDVLSPFELSYKVDWPLNVILTEKALDKYKLVFRFLLKLKRINWTLNENFLYLNSHFKNKRLKEENLAKSPHYHKIQIYRHAMTQVMITLDDYIFSNGVQYPWIYFLKDLETTENIDHLYQKHVRYIKDVLTRCFLSKNSQDLLECIHNMIELALKFHYTAKSSMMEVVNGSYHHPKFSVLKVTFNEFCAVIKVFLKTLKDKISSDQVLKSHNILIEKFDLKLT